MNPFYFGTSKRRIFGIHEPAVETAVPTGRKRAVVLCPPWGAEYIYAHRSMRQLAINLSLAGYHTLRFDYFGTGDSGGEMPEADLAGWEADVESAIEAVQEISGASQVMLIGLRLGANIAAAVAARRVQAIDALVMWDPIDSGEEYLRELGAWSPQGADPHDAALLEAGFTLELQGFTLSARMLADIRSVDLRSAVAAPAVRTLLLLTQQAPSGDSPTAVPPRPGTPSLSPVFVKTVCPWIESATVSGAVPVQAIQRIVEWLG